MTLRSGSAAFTKVALLAEGVDRNHATEEKDGDNTVALLAEGVDRNKRRLEEENSRQDVALLAEGVDRNRQWFRRPPGRPWSPSSRRAWIEICVFLHFFISCWVALLAEGVDRNWSSMHTSTVTGMVALLAEGVDRNF